MYPWFICCDLTKNFEGTRCFQQAGSVAAEGRWWRREPRGGQGFRIWGGGGQVEDWCRDGRVWSYQLPKIRPQKAFDLHWPQCEDGPEMPEVDRCAIYLHGADWWLDRGGTPPAQEVEVFGGQVPQRPHPRRPPLINYRLQVHTRPVLAAKGFDEYQFTWTRFFG